MRDPYSKRFTLSISEQMEMARIQKEASLNFRNLWIRVMKRHGLTNVEIAKEMDISESTVRAILKK